MFSYLFSVKEMAKKSQIFLTTFKAPVVAVRGARYFFVKMEDSVSQVEVISKPEAVDFIETGEI